MNFCGGNIGNKILLSNQIITSIGMKIIMLDPLTMKLNSEIKFDNLITNFTIYEHGLKLVVLLNNGMIKMFIIINIFL